MRTSSHIYNATVIVSLLLIPLILFALSYDGIENLSRLSAPDGQVFYLASKAFGLCAFVMLCWQIISALLTGNRGPDARFKAGKSLHIILGSILFLLIVLHVLSFVTAASLRSGDLNLGILVPNFTTGYYNMAVSLGVIALMLVVVALLAGAFRKKLPRTWRLGHLLVFIVVAMVFFHAWMIGSEIRSGVFMILFWMAVSCVTVPGLLRLKQIKDTR